MIPGDLPRRFRISTASSTCQSQLTQKPPNGATEFGRSSLLTFAGVLQVLDWMKGVVGFGGAAAGGGLASPEFEVEPSGVAETGGAGGAGTLESGKGCTTASELAAEERCELVTPTAMPTATATSATGKSVKRAS